MNIEQQITAPPRLGEQRIVLRNIRWQTYEAILHDLRDCSSVRLAYDRGDLEIMGPLYLHEWCKTRLRIAVTVLCEELGMELQGAGSTTFRREDLQRGIEPDECFYIRHLASILDRRELDLTRDPPPDLAIEVDITSSSINRQGIYEALRIPELWRFDGETLRVHILRTDGTYEASESSLSFPTIPLTEIVQLVNQSQGMGDVGFTKSVRAWVRQRLSPGPKGTGDSTGEG